jgi:hypothetical protein
MGDRAFLEDGFCSVNGSVEVCIVCSLSDTATPAMVAPRWSSMATPIHGIRNAVRPIHHVMRWSLEIFLGRYFSTTLN